MANLRQSLAKRLYEFLTLNFRLGKEWKGSYWYEQDGFRTVPCRLCPKFDSRRLLCRIPFGSPIRKCCIASIEANLGTLRRSRVLEVGCGASSYVKKLVKRLDSEWVGVDPASRFQKRRTVRTCFGYAASLPFENDSFDCIAGIQSFEHFEDPIPEIAEPATYGIALEEAWRVLRPNGLLYYDAPIHLHGHPMLIRGNIAEVTRLFGADKWHATFWRWRFDHAPLPAYHPPEFDVKQWAAAGLSLGEIDDLKKNKSVWLLAILARKIDKQ